MKTNISWLFFLATIFSNFQVISQVKHFNGYQYKKIDNQWHFYHEESQTTLKLVDNTATIKYNNGVSEATINSFEQSHGLTLQYKSKTGWYDYVVAYEGDFMNYADSLSSSPLIANLILPTFDPSSALSNDPLLNQQFALHHSADEDIDAPEAWGTGVTGSPNVIVAVIDGGTDWEHPDLGLGTDNYQNVWLNALENDWTDPNDPSTSNGIDNDNNGYLDDWKGYNFFTNGGSPSNNSKPDGNSQVHGTSVAGIVAAKTNNSRGVAGIAGGWNSEGAKIMTLKVGDDSFFNGSVIDQAIDYAVDNGANIINLSYSSVNSNQPDIIAAIDRAVNTYGCIVVASSGNKDIANVEFPASYPLTIGVGGSGFTGLRYQFANYGSDLSVTAPFNMHKITHPNNAYGYFQGTSASAPMVSGVCALALSANPCLSNEQVRDIIEQTTDKIGVGSYNYNWDNSRPGHSKEVGYGRVNAHQAVLAAQAMQSSDIDLYMKDTPEDFGQSPSPGVYTDAGPDIWYRNNDDGEVNQFSEDLVYNGSSFWIYVRVRNKSCVSSSGGNLKLYWSRLGTAFSWPTNWQAATSNGQGAEVGIEPIPAIDAGKSTILKFEWDMSTYIQSFSNSNISACLLARIDDIPTDPIGPTTNLYGDVKNENNLTMKNVVIREAQYFKAGNTISVFIGGTELPNTSYNILFHPPSNLSGNAIYEEAEVTIKMDQDTWDKWDASGRISTDLELLDEEQRLFLVTGANAFFGGLNYSENERSRIEIAVNFLIDELSEKNDFTYHIGQIINGAETVTGGVHLYISKEYRNEFQADAGNDQEIEINQSASLMANDISEPAIYNWYDEGGNLIFSGLDTVVNPIVTSKYQLEVISLLDGFKDYDELEITVNRFKIHSLQPNPVSSLLTVNYEAQQASSAYLMVTNVNTSVADNFIVNPNQSSVVIDLSSFNPGAYSVHLVCDGTVEHVMQLIIQ